MIATHAVLVLIPAGGGSKGLPRKNIVCFAGKPLIGWTIEQAHAGAWVDAVTVSTEDDETAEVAQRCGALAMTCGEARLT